MATWHCQYSDYVGITLPFFSIYRLYVPNLAIHCFITWNTQCSCFQIKCMTYNNGKSIIKGSELTLCDEKDVAFIS